MAERGSVSRRAFDIRRSLSLPRENHGTVIVAVLVTPQTVLETVQVPEAGLGPEF